MYEIGSKIRLFLPIVGKKNTFSDGLVGIILDHIKRESGLSYRIQFDDGRIAVIPEHILSDSSKTFEG